MLLTIISIDYTTNGQASTCLIARELLNKDDRDDFNEFVNTQTQFNPYNMFICNSKTNFG